MKMQELKNVNITALFSVPFNHLLISQGDIVKLFTTGDPQKDIFNFVEAPGIKIALFPNQKKEVVFENARLVVNDKSETDLSASTLISDFKKVFNSDSVDKDKVTAYGFNYDMLIELNGSKLTDLIGTKIFQLPDIKIKNAGITISRK